MQFYSNDPTGKGWMTKPLVTTTSTSVTADFPVNIQAFGAVWPAMYVELEEETIMCLITTFRDAKYIAGACSVLFSKCF